MGGRMTSHPHASISIVGAGSIGVAFAVLFASRGASVRIWDALPDAFDRAANELRSRLEMLAKASALDEPPDEVSSRISWHRNLAEALDGADLVQECAPEKIDLKVDLFRWLADLTPDHVVLASSSSAFIASRIAPDIEIRRRVLVGHPGNPPYLIPVIEVVPSPETAQAIIDRAFEIYRNSHLKPVLVRREVEGFIFNRLQGAVLREAYCLVRDGIASVDDIDEVMRSGLGPRWSVIGPFETADLNTRGGIASHAEKMGPAYARMGAERGQNDPWTPDLVDEVTRQRREIMPLDQWEARVRWRDEQLLKAKLARDLGR